MKEKREKTIRDYLYEEESNKTLTAKDIVSRIDFSTPQVKPHVRRKKKSKLKISLTCLSYILVVFFTSIAFFNSANNGKINNLYGKKTLIENYKPYNSIYFGEETIDIVYEINDEEMVFYIRHIDDKKSDLNDKLIVTYDDKVIEVSHNVFAHFATLKENEELEFDILYNGEQRHCIIQNLN